MIFPARQPSYQRNPARTGSNATQLSPFLLFVQARSASILIFDSNDPTNRSIDSPRFLSVIFVLPSRTLVTGFFFFFCSQAPSPKPLRILSFLFHFHDDPCSCHDFASFSNRDGGPCSSRDSFLPLK